MTDHLQPIAELRISALRRTAAMAIFAGLAAVLAWTLVTRPPGVALQILLVAGVGAALFGARTVWRSSARSVVLTGAGLFDDTGLPIAPLDQIAHVDAGFLAFRPSNGFSVRLRTPMASHWCPGLWWRAGRRIGVGGMTPRQSGKLMSTALAELMAKSGPDA